MFKINTASRLSMFILLIVGANLWLAVSFRFAPDPVQSEFRSRMKEAQALACSGAKFAESGRLTNFAELLENVCKLDPQLVSAGLSRPSGGYRIEVGDHSRNWIDKTGQPDQISIMIQANNQDWGRLELKHIPLHQQSGWFGWILGYPNNFILFVSCTSCLLAWIMFSRVFRYLDPSKVIPGRVRSALDTLAEGLVLLDPAENVVHVNEAFGRMLEVEPDSMIGERLNKWAWKIADAESGLELPWSTGLKNRKELTRKLLQLEINGEVRQYLVNSNPILADKGDSCRGALVSFDDVTQLERKKKDLADSFQSLKASRDEITRQNHQLQFLASRDPLTQCLNRRSFWEKFESCWQSIPVDRMNVLMVDLDHFKAINDCHGHSKGDDVLRETGALLMHLVGNKGLVFRYGGEEFTVLLPGIVLQGATDIADAVHLAFQDCKLGGLEVTASIGLSNRSFGAMDTQHLLDQADKCLYAAKRNGRNQVVRFDNMKLLEQKEEGKPADDGLSFERIPYLTVSALFNIVANRDVVSAGFCQDLAETCMEAGQTVLTRQQLYWLEVAALLHQSGAIVSSPNTRSRSRDADPAGSDLEFQRFKPASEFLTGVLGNCEAVRVLSLVESGDIGSIPAPDAPSGDLPIWQCAAVFEICDRFLQRRQNGEDPVTICNELRKQNLDTFREQVVSVLETSGKTNVSPDTQTMDVQPIVVATLARHHGNLNMAVIDRNISRLAKATEGIKASIPEAERSILEAELLLLDQAANDRDPDYEKLAQVVDQILGVCRLSRRQMVIRVANGESEQETGRVLAEAGLKKTSPGNETTPNLS